MEMDTSITTIQVFSFVFAHLLLAGALRIHTMVQVTDIALNINWDRSVSVIFNCTTRS
jgi:hypothetical protein